MYIHITKQLRRVSVYQYTTDSVTSTKTVPPLYPRISLQCEIWGEKEDVHRLEYDAVTSGIRVTAFQRILLLPSSEYMYAKHCKFETLLLDYTKSHQKETALRISHYVPSIPFLLNKILFTLVFLIHPVRDTRSIHTVLSNDSYNTGQGVKFLIM